MAVPALGSTLQRELSLDAAAIRSGAQLVGDFNPLHHDAAFAAASRYGELIASGAYTSALLAGLLSIGFGEGAEDNHGHVGVDYHVRFLGPVRVDRLVRMQWTVAELRERRSGVLARMEGRIIDMTDEATLLSADMSVLYFSRR